MKTALIAAAAGAALALTAGVTLTAAVTASSATVCGPAGPATRLAGHDLDPEQLTNAATIVATTARAGLPAQAAVIAVATAVQESTLRNLPYGDRDSLGLFQQRVGWGPAATRLDPAASTTLFLHALVQVPGWASLPVTIASDRVQHSAYPYAVATWESLARAVVARDWPTSTTAAGCAGQGGSGLTNDTTGTGAAGLSTPAGAASAVVAYALAQLGKPYRWGAEGPDAYDCSGLTMKAWAAAGVAIGRTTYTQAGVGVPVASVADLQPGDLIFIAGSDGTSAHPGHVGLYLGTRNGTPTLIHAPHTGTVVQLAPVSAWAGLIVTIRRPTT